MLSCQESRESCSDLVLFKVQHVLDCLVGGPALQGGGQGLEAQRMRGACRHSTEGGGHAGSLAS